MEPDWDDFERRLMALTVRELRELGRTWFAGMLGGASTKRDIAQTMTSQMRHWWRLGPDGVLRVRRVLDAIGDLEEGKR